MEAERFGAGVNLQALCFSGAALFASPPVFYDLQNVFFCLRNGSNNIKFHS